MNRLATVTAKNSKIHQHDSNIPSVSPLWKCLSMQTPVHIWMRTSRTSAIGLSTNPARCALPDEVAYALVLSLESSILRLVSPMAPNRDPQSGGSPICLASILRNDSTFVQNQQCPEASF
ncbi:hypothetical protein CERSUDRAFT_117052 [Gelatoporia subvermispora B]|uniref:Uncharacterized protein n=1 Tax=Ceriporiopsis subvermispora (strain B) TaxID=914234 RepID=M2R831_CERS8|nr:hypothetical protein CERSUDRAFT_117052 [Gelatoporia subvermispora B]